MASPEIEQIKERLNIAEVVGGYVQLQKAGRNFRARCPFHKERTPSFMVSPERGTYMCFGCGEKGDVISFVQKMDGIDFRSALQQLAERAGVALPKFSAKAPEQKAKEDQLRDRLLVCLEAAAEFFESELQKRNDVREYVAKRAVSEASARAWRIGYAPAAWDALSKHLLEKKFTSEEIIGAGLGIASRNNSQGSSVDPGSQRTVPGDSARLYDRFRGRIMFPIFDNANKVIAFSGRFFKQVPGSHEEGEPAKYVNSPETALFKKSRTLYGLNAAREAMRKLDCILLVEGQFDVVLAHQSGLRFAAAVSGTALTPEHLALLSRYSKRLLLALDADAAGLRSGLRSAAMALALGFDVKIPTMPEGCKDPADAAAKDPELLRAAVRESKTAIEFFLDALRRDAKDERGYKKMVEGQVLPLIAAIPSRIDEAHFALLVATRLNVPEDAVRAEVEKHTRGRIASLYQSEPGDETQAPTAAVAEEEKLSRLERATAMLLVRADLPQDTRAALVTIIGEDRVAHIAARAERDAEALRFEFEAIEVEGEDAYRLLLDTVAREKRQEELAEARAELRHAQSLGDAEATAAAVARIQTLAKEKHAGKK
ncbi:MAG: DNA primase [Minisyncoccia bacterium]